MRAWRSREWTVREQTVLVLGLLIVASTVFAPPTAASRGQAAAASPAAPPATRPPLVFTETWKLPPHAGEPTDQNMRFTPAVVTSPSLEAKLYGPGSSVVRAAQHEGRFDLWTGLATSPVAVMLRDRRNYVDLTGLARLRWMVRTNAIHMLHPVVKLADGTFIVGDRGISTGGEFLEVEVAFGGMRWYLLDSVQVVVMTEVKDPNLTRVDEVGLATLAPGGGHGIAGSANLSTIQLFAKAIPR